MKSFLFIGALLGMVNACNKNTTPTTSAAAGGYQINGQLQNAPAGTKVYLAELGETQFVSRDTATVGSDGKFTFTGTVPEAGIYQVKTDDSNQLLIALQNDTKMQLAGDAQQLGSTYTVKGSPDSEMLQKVVQKNQEQMMRLQQRYKEAAMANRTDSMQVIERQAEAMQRQVQQLVRQNPRSIASAFVVSSVLNLDDNFSLADSVATQLKTAQPDSRYTKSLVARLDQLRVTALGVQAPEINLTAPNGKPITLTSLRGKYVLIDFWASWCRPCRLENPNVVRAYNKFKDKGFEIYGVSFDQDRDKWLKAIQADGLTWTHVSDLKGWESAAGQSYHITSIPASFLLDPQGRIIGKNLRGDALAAKLATVLK